MTEQNFGYHRKMLLLPFLFATILCLANCGIHLFSERGNAKLKELEQLTSEIPLYPGFKELDSHSIVKTDRAGITKEFASNASYDDVKKYYLTELTQRGWKFNGERSLSNWGVDYGAKQLNFGKGEFSIAIQYEGGRDVGRDYGIDYGWISSDASSQR